MLIKSGGRSNLYECPNLKTLYSEQWLKLCDICKEARKASNLDYIKYCLGLKAVGRPRLLGYRDLGRQG